MPVSLSEIRNELLPGFFEIRSSYSAIPTAWEAVFAKQTVELEVNAAFNPILNPIISPVAAAAVAAAAVVIKNPDVTRRFWHW
jgi:hypothetical protein